MLDQIVSSPAAATDQSADPCAFATAGQGANAGADRCWRKHGQDLISGRVVMMIVSHTGDPAARSIIVSHRSSIRPVVVVRHRPASVYTVMTPACQAFGRQRQRKKSRDQYDYS